MKGLIKNQILSNMAAMYSIATWYLYGKKVFVVSESEGDSMLPTIENGSVLFVDRCMYKLQGLKKNDIVVATQPIDPSVTICKRITHTAASTHTDSSYPRTMSGWRATM
jgi:signal peptidase I